MHTVKTLVRPFLLLAVALVCSMSTGCSTIIGGANKSILVSSTPSNVPVKIYGDGGKEVAHGTTPFTVSLKRGRGYFKPAKYEFKATMPGMPTKVVGYRAGIHGWYWGNILLGGLIGMVIVDPITGAMWDPPSTVHIDLSGVAEPEDARKPTVEVDETEQASIPTVVSERKRPPGI
jgi:hypothetical protein